MDPISTALSTAWLDAIRRSQSYTTQRLQKIAPQTRPNRSERTLTDIIESGLKHGGAAPLLADDVPPAGQGRKLDILV